MFDGVLLLTQSSIDGKFQAAIRFRDFCCSAAQVKEAIKKNCQLLKVSQSRLFVEEVHF